MKASEVAGGISEALILTFEGVMLSVPAIYFFALFKNRVATLSVQTMNAADEFIRRIHTTAQKKPAPEAPAATPAAPSPATTT
jgi:biopolymer transport protein ExbB